MASRPEFASGLRTTKVIDDATLTGWFTEDFTWEELSTLRATERLPAVRPNGASFDGLQPVLKLRDLMDIIDAASIAQGRQLIMVAKIKHATYFASIGLPLDELFAAEIAGWATPENLITESFEQTVLMQIRERGVPGPIVFLAESAGSPATSSPDWGAAPSRIRRTSPTPDSRALRTTASTECRSTRPCCCEWMPRAAPSAPPTRR